MRQSSGEIRILLKKLDGESADAIESQTIECKPWDSNPKARESQLRALRENVVGFANANGGTIILGIADRKRTRREAIQGVGRLEVDMIRKAIYDGTDPAILVDIEEIIESECRILLIHIPKGIPPHLTSEGVGKIRVGKECKPLRASDLSRLFIASRKTDFSAEVVPGATIADLDPEQIKALKTTIRAERGSEDLAGLSSTELLRSLDLAREEEVTFSAILLLGRSTALARWVPQHEVTFLKYSGKTRYEVRHDLKGPLIAVLEVLHRLLDAHVRIETVAVEGFRELSIPEVSWWVAREAILNAIVHRDYFLRQSVMVELHPDRLVVVSPGGFFGGVGPRNILRHPPVRRNSLLADVLQRVGLVNRAGIGVDRIFEEMLRNGKAIPRYEADESFVRLVLHTPTHSGFACFVEQEQRAGARLELEDLILLRTASEQGFVNRWSGAECLQRTEEEAAEFLTGLRTRGYLEPVGRGKGTAYRVPAGMGKRLGAVKSIAGVTTDPVSVRHRILNELVSLGRLTNVEVRAMLGVSRLEAARIMQRLRDEGEVRLVGQGRGAHWVPEKKK